MKRKDRGIFDRCLTEYTKFRHIKKRYYEYDTKQELYEEWNAKWNKKAKNMGPKQADCCSSANYYSNLRNSPTPFFKGYCLTDFVDYNSLFLLFLITIIIVRIGIETYLLICNSKNKHCAPKKIKIQNSKLRKIHKTRPFQSKKIKIRTSKLSGVPP